MTTPMYQEIADQLRDRIESGEFAPAERLPTEQELQSQYNASRNTIRDAIKQLTSLSLVETKPGQGTFVVPPIDPFVTTLTGNPVTARGGDEGASYASEISDEHREPSFSPVQVEIQDATQEVADGLWIAPGSEVISRHQRRFVDGIPWSLQTSFYPGEFADRGAERLRRTKNFDEGAVRYLQDTIGVRQVGYRDWITVRAPNAVEAAFFKLPRDGRTGVYEIFRTGFDGNGQPMRLTVTVFPTDRNQFIIDVGSVPPPKPGTAADNYARKR
jgi:GntR family transcriptional regulator